MSVARAHLRRFACERGYTLVELVAVMATMGTVLAMLTGVWLSGNRAQSDLDQRVQGQNNAAMALARLRRDVHCANQVQGATTSTLTLTSACAAGQTVRWCATLTSPGRYVLRRSTTATCTATSVQVADWLSSNALFTHAAATQATRATIRVNVAVRTPEMATPYTLCSVLALRNIPFAASGAGVPQSC